MHSLKFDSFNITVNDCVLDGDLYVFDVKFPIKDFFDLFESYCSNHCSDENSFNYSVDGVSYHGRFGALIYDINYNARFYMTTAPNEPFNTHVSAYEFNMSRIIHNHEERISTLIDILSQKNFLTDSDIAKLSPYLPYKKGCDMDFTRQVKNLDQYLDACSSTMEDIRNDIKENEHNAF